MKLFSLVLGALASAVLVVSQGDTTTVSTRSQVDQSPTWRSIPASTTTYAWRSNPPRTRSIPFIPTFDRRGDQPAPTTPPSETTVCQSGSTTTIKTVLDPSCNWFSRTGDLTCTTATSTALVCETTGPKGPPPVLPTRSIRRVVAQQAGTTMDFGGRRSIRRVNNIAEAMPTSMDFGGRRSQRVVAERAQATAGVPPPEMTCPSGFVGPNCPSSWPPARTTMQTTCTHKE